MIRSNLLKPKKVFSLLREETKLSDNDIKLMMESLGIKPDENVMSLGFSERKLLALEITFNKSKNIIINCSGLDYSGISIMRQRVIRELSEGAVIELNYLNSKGREYLLDREHNVRRTVVDVELKSPHQP